MYISGHVPRGDGAPIEIALRGPHQEIAIVYCAADNAKSSRTIKPTALRALVGGEVALVAECRLRGDFRMFALARIEHARIGDAVFDAAGLASLYAEDIDRLTHHVRGVAALVSARRAPAARTPVAQNPVAKKPAQPEPIQSKPAARKLKSRRSGPEKETHPEVVEASKALGRLIAALEVYLLECSEITGETRSAASVAITGSPDRIRARVDPAEWRVRKRVDMTAHARVSELRSQRGAENAAEAFGCALRAVPGLGGDGVAAHLAVSRMAKNGALRAIVEIDGVSLHADGLSGSSWPMHLKKRLLALEGLGCRGQGPRWMIETGASIVKTCAADPEAAAIKARALTGVRDLEIVDIALLDFAK